MDHIEKLFRKISAEERALVYEKDVVIIDSVRTKSEKTYRGY